MIRDAQSLAPAHPKMAVAAGATPPVMPQVPAWALARGPVASDAEAAFCAGAALTALDTLVRREPLWAGAWRQRLALKCAVAATKLAGRTEDEAALRDAWLLSRPGDRLSLGFGGAPKPGSTSLGSASLGPAGNILAAWRHLAATSTSRSASPLDVEALRKVVEKMGLRWDNNLASLPTQIEALLRNGSEQPAPFAAAAMAAKVHAARPDAELLAWWLADLVLAKNLRWPRPVPLLMGQVFSTDGAGGARGSRTKIRVGGEKFERAVCLVLAQGAAEACRMGAEMARRAERLMAIAPKLRAKGAPDAIQLLLDDDAVSGALVTKNLSRFASRRLFERLHGFDAVRELSGRPTFRIYGL